MGNSSTFDIKGLGALRIPNTGVNAVYGTTATKISVPSPLGHKRQVLVLMAVAGDWVVRAGEFVSSGMPSTFNPGASVTNGTAGVPIADGQALIIDAAEDMTVKGFAGTDALVYWWM